VPQVVDSRVNTDATTNDGLGDHRRSRCAIGSIQLAGQMAFTFNRVQLHAKQAF